MKLENQVVSLELAKKLKELGVPQESWFLWWHDDACHHFVGTDWKSHRVVAAAFTVAELGEMLPKDISSDELDRRFPFVANRKAGLTDDEMMDAEDNILEDFKSVFSELYDHDGYEDGFAYGIRLNYGQGTNLYYFFNSEEWECNYQVFEVEGDTEADARAKMLIYLWENNLM